MPSLTTAALIDNAIYLVILSTVYVNGQPEVDTRNGKVRGTRRDLFNGQVDAFLGIPYAEPPVGELRFKLPEPFLKPWEGVRDATEFSDACCQVPIESTFRGETMWDVNAPISEDCLYLNVWTPYPRGTLNLPVMVWIYGGSLVTGAASVQLYNGATLAREEQVVVVSLNYRIGVFGFLALRDPRAPGNMGFVDQALALQWVKDNIEYFGGDPGKVTIFGESAGALSVGLHLHSSQVLFQRAILQSGSSIFPGGVVSNDRAEKLVLQIADNLNCGITRLVNETLDATDVLDCFNSKTTEVLSKAQLLTGIVFSTPAVVDGNFLKDYPSNLLNDGLFKSTQILIGSNLDEGSWFLPYYIPQYFSAEQQPALNRTTFASVIELSFALDNTITHEAISFEYTNWLEPDNSVELVAGASASYGDYLLTCSVNEFAKTIAKHNNDVYLYYFTERASNTPWLPWYGVLHADEIPFSFGMPLHQENGFTDAEEALSREMMKYWANFAKTGNPNKASNDDVSENVWPRFDLEEEEYLILKTGGSVIGRKMKPRKCAFWRELYPKMSIATVPERSNSGDPVTCSSQRAEFTVHIILFTCIMAIMMM